MKKVSPERRRAKLGKALEQAVSAQLQMQDITHDVVDPDPDDVALRQDLAASADRVRDRIRQLQEAES